MRALAPALACLLSLAAHGAAARVAPRGQAPAKSPGARGPKAGAALKEYAGRYELEAGLIPVSTLDVTLADGELWVKPTGAKRRRLLRKSGAAFTDEVGGTPVTFDRDDEGKVVSLTFT
ncbi:MAG TPA: DUF3471 domain-containing protein, partial [Pyrinomonadaceae bacterium]